MLTDDKNIYGLMGTKTIRWWYGLNFLGVVVTTKNYRDTLRQNISFLNASLSFPPKVIKDGRNMGT